jgi:hypothetical protein
MLPVFCPLLEFIYSLERLAYNGVRRGGWDAFARESVPMKQIHVATHLQFGPLPGSRIHCVSP